MKINDITIGGEINKQLFDAIKDFKILQLKIVKQSNGVGLIEIKGSINESKMAAIEKILSNNN